MGMVRVGGKFGVGEILKVTYGGVDIQHLDAPTLRVALTQAYDAEEKRLSGQARSIVETVVIIGVECK